MKIYRTKTGVVVEHEAKFYHSANHEWDQFINRDGLFEKVRHDLDKFDILDQGFRCLEENILPPVGSQEVWAAGVTYFQSKTARVEESKDQGGDNFYNRVYDAERPELFFKATPIRVVGHKAGVRIRQDSSWNVPEPELTLFINSSGNISGFTIGNDMSSRSIEGENPLYLTQAKIYDKSAAIGPCILAADGIDRSKTEIQIKIERGEICVFAGFVSLDQMKRSFEELAGFLFRESSFPTGCFLMTGTGIVPQNDFTLKSGDWIHITIDNIGTLSNFVE